MIKYYRFLKVCFLILLSLPESLQELKSQNDTGHPWENDPKLFVQNLAIDASKQQVAVQEQIKSTEAIVSTLKSKWNSSTTTTAKDYINKAITINENLLKSLRISLKEKIKISQNYKSLLGQTPDQIKTYLIKENPGVRHVELTSVPVTAKSPAPSNARTATVEDTKVQTSPATGYTPNPIASPVFKFENWVGVTVPVPACKYQVFLDPKKNKGVEAELLFSYTPDEIKKALKGISYTKGYAFIGKEPGFTFLQLNIEIASDLALQHYGNLNKSFMVITLINGKQVRLINNRFDNGRNDLLKKTTSLSGIYYIDKNDEKVLNSAETDSIRLNYASGFEDYVIYNVDFFMRQLACINALK